MLLTDRYPDSSRAVTEIFQPLSRRNQQLYARLRSAVGLGLRRQVIIAVCDDSNLRHQLAQTLTQDSAQAHDRFLYSSFPSPSEPETIRVPFHPVALINLTLRANNPDLASSLAHAIAQRTPRTEPVFQILGIEHLTRQPAHIQHAFLHQLRAIGRSLGDRPWSLILWVSRPWQRTIQQSAPEFWRWHTGLFEFEGDPLPLRTVSAPAERSETIAESSSRTLRSPAQPVDRAEAAPQPNPTLADSVLDSVMQSMLTPTDESTQTPFSLLQQIEHLQRQAATDTDLALAYRQLGNWYRDRAEQEATLLQLKLGIQAYEQAMLHLQDDPVTGSDVLNDVGNLYWMLARQSSTAEDQSQALQTAIDRYEAALGLTSPETAPLRYAMLQNNLGAAYSDRANQCHPEEIVDNLQRSISAYTAALQYRPADQDPQRYAAINNNLGTTYWNLAQHTAPAENLQHAIAAYRAALPFYDPQQAPLPYAMIQNNLGTAYWNLSQCDRLDPASPHSSQALLREAIAAYQLALQYRTPEAAPVSHAATQNNLGTAYWNLANDPTTHPKDAITHLNTAITAYRSVIDLVDTLQHSGAALNFDPYATHHNLASAYYQAATHPHNPLEATGRLDYLHAALHHHLQAWQGWQNHPDLTQAALEGMIQVVRICHDRLGVQAQTQAMSQIPASLLPIVMQQL